MRYCGTVIIWFAVFRADNMDYQHCGCAENYLRWIFRLVWLKILFFEII